MRDAPPWDPPNAWALLEHLGVGRDGAALARVDRELAGRLEDPGRRQLALGLPPDLRLFVRDAPDELLADRCRHLASRDIAAVGADYRRWLLAIAARTPSLEALLHPRDGSRPRTGGDPGALELSRTLPLDLRRFVETRLELEAAAERSVDADAQSYVGLLRSLGAQGDRDWYDAKGELEAVTPRPRAAVPRVADHLAGLARGELGPLAAWYRDWWIERAIGRLYYPTDF